MRARQRQRAFITRCAALFRGCNRPRRSGHLLRVLPLGAVFVGNECNEPFRAAARHVHVPKPRCIWKQPGLDDRRDIVQCSRRAFRVGAIARCRRRSTSASLYRKCCTAARSGSHQIIDVLQLFLVPLAAVVLSMDHLQMAVAQDLMSRYCPHSKAVFLTRLCLLSAVPVVAGIVLLVAGRRTGAPPALRIAAYALLLFAVGSGALVLYGLSGCSGAAAEGLIWTWP